MQLHASVSSLQNANLSDRLTKIPSSISQATEELKDMFHPLKRGFILNSI
jgi:hypothetical protein